MVSEKKTQPTKRSGRNARKGALRHRPILLVDEGFQLLRTVPVSFFVVYLVGTLPFFASLLLFLWTMVHNAEAWRICLPITIGLSCAYVWMKVWQSRFSVLIWSWIGGEPPPEMSITWFFRCFARQLSLQPYGLIAGPIALLSLILFPSVYVFFQTTSLLSGREDGEFRQSFLGGVQQLSGNPFAHARFVLTLGSTWIMTMVAVLIIGMIAPFLLNALTGLDSPFSRGETSFLHGTMGVTLWLSITYVIVDPLARASVALTVFYKKANTTGADLLAELRAIVHRRTRGMAPIVAIGLFMATGVAFADVTPDRYDKAVKSASESSDYSWRIPQPRIPLSDTPSPLEQFYHWIANGIEAGWDWCHEMGGIIYDGVTDWFKRWFLPQKKAKKGGSPGASSWSPYVEALFRWLLAAALVIAIVIGGMRLFKYLRNRKPAEFVIPESGPTGPVNLEDENLTADRLPEEKWMFMAEDLEEKGDLRLALRATYLGLLAYLGGRHLIAIAKFKSNLDYSRELERRHHELATVLSLFRDNVRSFELAWYGWHEVEPRDFDQFKKNVEAIRRETGA